MSFLKNYKNSNCKIDVYSNFSWHPVLVTTDNYKKFCSALKKILNPEDGIFSDCDAFVINTGSDVFLFYHLTGECIKSDVIVHECVHVFYELERFIGDSLYNPKSEEIMAYTLAYIYEKTMNELNEQLKKLKLKRKSSNI